jgi:hypothetical protein
MQAKRLPTRGEWEQGQPRAQASGSRLRRLRRSVQQHPWASIVGVAVAAIIVVVLLAGGAGSAGLNSIRVETTLTAKYPGDWNWQCGPNYDGKGDLQCAPNNGDAVTPSY